MPLACVAHAPTVEDHAMGQQRPFLALDEHTHRVLDLDRVGLVGPFPATHEPLEVGVDRDTRHIEGVTEDDVGGLAPMPGSATRSFSRAGTSPSCRSSRAWPRPMSELALLR